MANQASCLICGATFGARTSYGLCPACCHKDTLREFDRWHSAIKHAQQNNLPASLTLLQYLGTVSDFRGMCAFCQLMPHSMIEIMNPYEGLTWHNIVPVCRSCSYVKRTGFGSIQQRIEKYLLANQGRTEDDINLEYYYTPEDGMDIIAPVEAP